LLTVASLVFPASVHKRAALSKRRPTIPICNTVEYQYTIHHVRLLRGYHLVSVTLFETVEGAKIPHSSVTCILLPAYISYKALRSRDPAQSHPWLIYFTILSLVQLLDAYTLFITNWIPFFGVFRLFFMLYLVLPQTQGAKIIYLDYLEPYIVHHENQIDEFITTVHQKLQTVGFGYITMLIEIVREKILRQQSPQPPPQERGADYKSYANDFLSQFLMPQARPSANQPVGGIYGAISGFAASMGGGAQAGHARGLAEHEAASVPDSLLSDNMGNVQDPAQKQQFISSQRERLTGILKALEAEQQNIDLAYGSSGAMSKSKSDASFVNVGHDDFQAPPPVTSSSRQTSGSGWGQAAQAAAGWLGGDGDKKGGKESSGWSAARDITAAISSGLDRNNNDSSDRRR
jgi:hypothetical protein